MRLMLIIQCSTVVSLLPLSQPASTRTEQPLSHVCSTCTTTATCSLFSCSIVCIPESMSIHLVKTKTKVETDPCGTMWMIITTPCHHLGSDPGIEAAVTDCTFCSGKSLEQLCHGGSDNVPHSVCPFHLKGLKTQQPAEPRNSNLVF